MEQTITCQTALAKIAKTQEEQVNFSKIAKILKEEEKEVFSPLFVENIRHFEWLLDPRTSPQSRENIDSESVFGKALQTLKELKIEISRALEAIDEFFRINPKTNE